VTGGGTYVDRARRAGLLFAADDTDVAEVRLGGRITGQGADVDVGLERRGVQDARDGEPPAAQPDPPLGVDAVDAQLPRGGRTEHRDRQTGGALVEPVAACEAGAEHGQQVQAGGSHLEAAGLGHRDHRAPVDLLVLHQGGVRHQLDVVQERDPCRRFAGELRQAAGKALAGLDGQQVRAEPVDLRDQPGLRGGGQPEDRDDRCGADRDPERGKRGAQRPGAEPDARHPQPVLQAQPSALGTQGASPFALSETTWPSSMRIWRGS
jgi:hypothetical protein